MVLILQSILLLVHAVLYGTWVFFWREMQRAHRLELGLALAVLSASFVAASFLAHKHFNSALRVFYTAAAVWLGLVNFLFLAACGCWIVYGASLLFGAHLGRHTLVVAFLAAGVLCAVAAAVNASWTRVVRVTAQLPHLPPSWHGRTAAVVSDLHLGHVRNRRFLRRMVRLISELRPDILFIPGDVFDGTAANLSELTRPWAELRVPFGAYFAAGNHEQFFSPAHYFETIRQSGIHLLNNEKVVVNGLQIVGIHYRDAAHAERMRSILASARLDPNSASILIVHNPNRLPIAEDAGISLQVSGHTHRGQFFPWTLIVKRMYGSFAYGLHLFGHMLVYTSCGAGTWGPPMRLGSNPEIALIRLEPSPAR